VALIAEHTMLWEHLNVL